MEAPAWRTRMSGPTTMWKGNATANADGGRNTPGVASEWGIGHMKGIVIRSRVL